MRGARGRGYALCVPADDGHLQEPAFYFDLASPDCYLAAERILQLLPTPLQWQPISLREVHSGAFDADADRARWTLEAERQDLQALRLPAQFPFDSHRAMLAATYAMNIGRTVAFAQAAFRQAFAGGHSLADEQYVLIAGAACEMHPVALLRALDSRAIAAQLAQASDDAAATGVTELPAVRVAGRLFLGATCLDAAAAHLRTESRHTVPAGATEPALKITRSAEALAR